MLYEVITKRTFKAWLWLRIPIEGLMAIVQSVVCTTLSTALLRTVYRQSLPPAKAEAATETYPAE